MVHGDIICETLPDRNTGFVPGVWPRLAAVQRQTAWPRTAWPRGDLRVYETVLSKTCFEFTINNMPRDAFLVKLDEWLACTGKNWRVVSDAEHD